MVAESMQNNQKSQESQAFSVLAETQNHYLNRISGRNFWHSDLRNEQSSQII